MSGLEKKRVRISKKILIQLAVTSVLLALVLRKLDSGKLITVLERVSLSSILILALVYLLGQCLSAFKWSLLVKNAHLERPLREIYRAYFLGMFVNSFGLGTVGGDVTRALVLKPEKGRRASTFATVIADRIHGLGVLLTIGAVAIAIYKPAVLGARAGIVATIGATLLLIGWFLGPRLLILIGDRTSHLGETARNIARAFPHRPQVFIFATLLSFIFHSSQLLMHAMMAYSLRVELPLSYIFATIPLANAASSLPISIQGLGVRESAYVALLTPIGIEPEVCVAFGALWFLTAQIVSALGALVIAPGLLIGKEKVEDLVEEDEEVIQEQNVGNAL